ncbi:MAG: hypothetical protein WA666_11855 [Nitrospirota bacterium]
MEFMVKEPCEIKRTHYKKNGIKTKNRKIDEDNACWKTPECDKDYCTYPGCYVFALKISGGYRPIYVGKTNKSFKDESFSTSNLKKYNEALIEHKGIPVLFFIYDSNFKKYNGKISQKNSKIITKVENVLIEAGAIKNPDLKNIRGKNKKIEWSIKGVINNNIHNNGKGKPNGDARTFKKMMGFN